MRNEKDDGLAEEPSKANEPRAFEVAFNGPTDHNALKTELDDEFEDSSEA